MKRLLLCLLLLPSLASANDWDALRQDGAIAVMRHALAPGVGDPDNFKIGACETQRNLDARGTAQAKAVGQALREQGITFDLVLTSQWCRTRETAVLMDVGPVTDAVPLNSFFQDFSSRAEQTRAAIELVNATEGKLLLVSHQVNISALTGQNTRSGEILVVKRGTDGLEVIGSILIAPE